MPAAQRSLCWADSHLLWCCHDPSWQAGPERVVLHTRMSAYSLCLHAYIPPTTEGGAFSNREMFLQKWPWGVCSDLKLSSCKVFLSVYRRLWTTMFVPISAVKLDPGVCFCGTVPWLKCLLLSKPQKSFKVSKCFLISCPKAWLIIHRKERLEQF